MKKIALIIALLMFMATASFSQDLKENVHYKVLDWEKKPNLITEVYSVYCSYCYRYETSVIPALKAALPDDAVFEEMHLDKMGKYGQAASNVLAVAKTINEGKYQKIKEAYFIAVLIDRVNFDKEKDFIDFGLKAGEISSTEYAVALKSPETQALLKRWEHAVEIAVLQGTPSIVVNNKYLVLVSSVKSVEQFNSIVLELLKK